MGGDKQIAVRMVLSPVVEFLSVVEGVVNRLGAQQGFSESQRVHLKQGVAQACGRVMEKARGEAEELRVEFSGFADRLEIALDTEDGSAGSNETDLYLLNQLMDKVVVEEAEGGRVRLTLVMYRSGGEGPS